MIEAAFLQAKLLRSAIEELEEQGRKNRINPFFASSLYETALLLGFKEIAERTLSLVPRVPSPDGTISNIDVSALHHKQLTWIPPALEKIEAQYPPWTEENSLHQIRGYKEEHLELCLSGKIDAALTSCREPRQAEEVASTLVLLRDFDGAVAFSQRAGLGAERMQGVMLAITIEAARAQNVGMFATGLQELQRLGLGLFTGIHLALGLAGRRPWDGYPFPDY